MSHSVDHELIIKTCRCCGTVLVTTPVEKLEDVNALEYAKRALEVAAVGDHPIVFLSQGNRNDTKRLATIAKNNFGCTSFALQPCVWERRLGDTSMYVFARRDRALPPATKMAPGHRNRRNLRPGRRCSLRAAHDASW